MLFHVGPCCFLYILNSINLSVLNKMADPGFTRCKYYSLCAYSLRINTINFDCESKTQK